MGQLSTADQKVEANWNRKPKDIILRWYSSKAQKTYIGHTSERLNERFSKQNYDIKSVQIKKAK